MSVEILQGGAIKKAKVEQVSYRNFLKNKLVSAESVGLDIDETNAFMKPFQSHLGKWSMRKGRAALWSGCGLGKTLNQLDWAYRLHEHKGGDAIVLTPLAVAQQTLREAEKFGIPVNLAASQEDVKPGINITNYEKLHHFDTSHFKIVVADEASILKSYNGATKKKLIESFCHTQYRLACTATPAPNDHLEIGNHAEFLGVMESPEMISRWFINDTMRSGGYRLKNHARQDFWRWVSTWAASVRLPSDLGYSDEEYLLPPLNLEVHYVSVDADGMLFRCDNLTATTLHKEMRRTAKERAAGVAELVNASKDNWVIWCNTNYEADELNQVIHDAIEVRGSHSENIKEERLNAFSCGQERVIISKPRIAGFGLNWQHCHNVAFIGLSFSFEQFYQALRRLWRFGQKYAVNCHVFAAETEGAVLATINRKQRENDAMSEEMVQASRHALAHDKRELVDYKPTQPLRFPDWLQTKEVVTV